MSKVIGFKKNAQLIYFSSLRKHSINHIQKFRYIIEKNQVF